jgi:hypothetical protein
MATSVCAKDSRTIAQRRADAATALVEGCNLTCDCGQPECPARNTDAEPGAVRTVINVIATADTVTGDSDQPGYLEGYGVIDAEQVRALAENSALRPVGCPTVTPKRPCVINPHRRWSAGSRCRDVTCRFPGCDRPATHCDIDHTTPFNYANPAAGGLTVPGNLACYCREHHRLKTFHGGPSGWRDQQLADGTGNRPPVKTAKEIGRDLSAPGLRKFAGSKNAQVAMLTENMARLEHKTVEAARARGYDRFVFVWEVEPPSGLHWAGNERLSDPGGRHRWLGHVVACGGPRSRVRRGKQCEVDHRDGALA